MPGKRAGAKQKPQSKGKKGKRVSGNPAKRAAAAQGKPAQPADGAAAFGFGAQPGAEDFELPKELKDLL